MSVTDFLQDGSIILLAGSQIIQSFTIRNLRQRLSTLKAKAKTSDHNPDSLIQQYEDNIARNDYRRPFFHTPAGNADNGFNFRLFSAGDSVKVYGFDGELILRGYSEDGFIAETRTLPFSRFSATVAFHPNRVMAWKRNNGEWPVDWFTGGSDCRTGSSNANDGEEETDANGTEAAQETSMAASPLRHEDSGTSTVPVSSVSISNEDPQTASRAHRGSK